MEIFLLLFLGLILLFTGGEALLRGSLSLAINCKLSNILVSAVIMGFGTSMPELMVTLNSVLQQASDLALGNVIGSNIANILLIIGFSAIIYPITKYSDSIKFEVNIMLLVSIIFTILIYILDKISLLTGLLMFFGLLSYIFYSYFKNINTSDEYIQHLDEDSKPAKQYSNLTSTIFVIIGIILLIFGAKLLVDNAIKIAEYFNISQAIIGMTIVAVGSSLPELTTAIISSIHKHNDVVLGNVLGSNIFNILGIIGISALFGDIVINFEIIFINVIIMLSVAILIYIILISKLNINRFNGCIFLLLYTIYIAYSYYSDFIVK